MGMPESPSHLALKQLLVTKLKAWYGASIKEYPSSGHELDVFAVTSSGVGIYIEIIWSPSKTQFLSDINMLQVSDADVKLVVANPEIIAHDEMVREFDKVVISQRKLGYAIHGELLNGQRILDNSNYVDHDLRNLTDELVSRVQRQFRHPTTFQELKSEQVNYRAELREEIIRLRQELENIDEPQVIHFLVWNRPTPEERLRLIGGRDRVEHDLIQSFYSAMQDRYNYQSKIRRSDSKFAELNTKCIKAYDNVVDAVTFVPESSYSKEQLQGYAQLEEIVSKAMRESPRPGDLIDVDPIILRKIDEVVEVKRYLIEELTVNAWNKARTGKLGPAGQSGLNQHLFNEFHLDIEIHRKFLSRQLRASIKSVQVHQSESQKPPDLGILRVWKSNLTSNAAALTDPQRRLERLIFDDRPLDTLTAGYPQLVDLMTDLRAQIAELNRDIESYDTIARSQIEYLQMPSRFISASMSLQEVEEIKKSRKWKSWAQDYLSMIDLKRKRILALVESLKSSINQF